MRHLISTICIVLFLWGCDNSAAVPSKPLVVRKKIVAPRKQTVQASTENTVPQVKPKPVAQRQAKQVTAKVDNNRGTAEKQLPANQKPESRRLVAQQNNTGLAPSRSPGQPQPKKPALSPKSEITVIKRAVRNQTQPGGGSTVAGNKTKTTNSVASLNMLPGGDPAFYNPTDKIDPFEPLLREKAALAKKKKKIKRAPRTPLERIDLSQLKLVGIILASSGNRALVEESSGKGYVVKTGTYIGINGGKIVKIEKELVTVEEQFEDVFGKIQTQKRKLKLPKPPGEF
jgi:type IV pilus assembly protein PilP